MDKRVESFQADCLDGGSTPPSSTRKGTSKDVPFLVESKLLFLHFPPANSTLKVLGATLYNDVAKIKKD